MRYINRRFTYLLTYRMGGHGTPALNPPLIVRSITWAQCSLDGANRHVVYAVMYGRCGCDGQIAFGASCYVPGLTSSVPPGQQH